MSHKKTTSHACCGVAHNELAENKSLILRATKGGLSAYHLPLRIVVLSLKETYLIVKKEDV